MLDAVVCAEGGEFGSELGPVVSPDLGGPPERVKPVQYDPCDGGGVSLLEQGHEGPAGVAVNGDKVVPPVEVKEVCA